jgi:hypothetical protein
MLVVILFNKPEIFGLLRRAKERNKAEQVWKQEFHFDIFM